MFRIVYLNMLYMSAAKRHDTNFKPESSLCLYFIVSFGDLLSVTEALVKSSSYSTFRFIRFTVSLLISLLSNGNRKYTKVSGKKHPLTQMTREHLLCVHTDGHGVDMKNKLG